jgi:predicted nucleic acid-binding protein
LIDTGIWVDVERGALAPADVAAITDKEPIFLSSVTIAELKFGAEIASTPALKQKRLAAVARLMRSPVLRIDEHTAEIFGRLGGALRLAGSGAPKHRVQDIWMASQAIQYGMRLLTNNRKDFADIPGLELVVWDRALKPR